MRENKKIERLFRTIKNKLNNMTDKEFLACPEFYRMVKAQIDGMLEPNEKVYVEFESTNSEMTAYTNGNLIHANTWSPLVVDQANRYLMYLSNIGSASHEVGHVLYTNFTELNSIRKDMMKLKFHFKSYEEYKKRDLRIQKLFAEEMCDMVNVVEDCYIENCLANYYPSTGIVVQGLNVGNQAKYDLTPSFIELEQRVEDGELLLLQLGIALLQIHCALGYTPKDFDKCSGPIHDQLVQFVKDSKPIVDEYKVIDRNHAQNIEDLVELCYQLLPSDDEIFENMPDPNEESGNGKSSDLSQESSSDTDNSSNNGSSSENQSSNSNSEGNGKEQTDSQSQNGDSNSSMSEKKKQERIETLSKNSSETKEACGKSNDFKGEGSNVRRSMPKSNDEEDGNATQNIVDQTERMIREIVERELQEAINKENSQEMQDASKEVMDEYFPRSNCDIKDITLSQYTNRGNEIRYKHYYDNIKETSKKCQRRIKQILETRPDDDYDSGHLMGSKFNVNDVYHKDGKYFSREVVPADQPDVAFSILVDNSGSMSGRKIENAIQTAILFEDICTGLNIPLQIYAHTTRNSSVTIGRCIDFNRVKNDKYSLTEMDACEANVDTVALSLMANQLVKRPEASKVLIVISDGLPCSTLSERQNNFKGILYKTLDYDRDVYSMKELNACIRYWRKKHNLKVIGVAIDAGKAVKAIYEDGFLDCTDLERLPAEMVKIFKKYVLK